jgi:hypothetical protein
LRSPKTPIGLFLHSPKICTKIYLRAHRSCVLQSVTL